jgi:WD40 repeat protein
VFLSPDGKRMTLHFMGGTVKVWDTTTGKELYSPRGVPGVISAAFSADGRCFALASDHLTKPQIRIYDAVKGTGLRTLRVETGRLLVVTFSPDGRYLAGAGSNGLIQLWNVRTGREALRLRGHSEWVRSLAFHPDGQRLASASDDRTVKIWDTVLGRELLSLPGHEGPVNQVVFGPDGHRLASADRSGTVKVWDATPREEEGSGGKDPHPEKK